MLIAIMTDIWHYVKLAKKKTKWRSNNKHNNIKISDECDISRISAGNYSYGYLHARMFPNSISKLVIGHFCSIADSVTFMVDGEHSKSCLSTFPVGNYTKKSKGDICVNDDVWIGEKAIILSGVTIGQGAIVGAGTIVSKDIPPYAVVVNNRILKYRFDDKIVEKLMQIDYSKISIENLEKLNSIDLDDGFFNSEAYRKICKG